MSSLCAQTAVTWWVTWWLVFCLSLYVCTNYGDMMSDLVACVLSQSHCVHKLPWHDEWLGDLCSVSVSLCAQTAVTWWVTWWLVFCLSLIVCTNYRDMMSDLVTCVLSQSHCVHKLPWHDEWLGDLCSVSVSLCAQTAVTWWVTWWLVFCLSLIVCTNCRDMMSDLVTCVLSQSHCVHKLWWHDEWLGDLCSVSVSLCAQTTVTWWVTWWLVFCLSLIVCTNYRDMMSDLVTCVLSQSHCVHKLPWHDEWLGDLCSVSVSLCAQTMVTWWVTWWLVFCLSLIVCTNYGDMMSDLVACVLSQSHCVHKLPWHDEWLGGLCSVSVSLCAQTAVTWWVTWWLVFCLSLIVCTNCRDMMSDLVACVLSQSHCVHKLPWHDEWLGGLCSVSVSLCAQTTVTWWVTWWLVFCLSLYVCTNYRDMMSDLVTCVLSQSHCVHKLPWHDEWLGDLCSVSVSLCAQTMVTWWVTWWLVFCLSLIVCTNYRDMMSDLVACVLSQSHCVHKLPWHDEWLGDLCSVSVSLCAQTMVTWWVTWWLVFCLSLIVCTNCRDMMSDLVACVLSQSHCVHKLRWHDEWLGDLCSVSVSMWLFQTKVVEKFFSNPQMTAANARLINDTLQHSMQFARVGCFCPTFFIDLLPTCSMVVSKVTLRTSHNLLPIFYFLYFFFLIWISA